MKKKYLISICIPTFNRSSRLSMALDCLTNQVKKNDDKVELIISDNNSSDDTKDILSKYSSIKNIKYFKNNENLGACANIILLTKHYATGKFCWVVGDDDIICSDGVDELIRIIESNENIEYFFLNHRYENESEREKYKTEDSRKILNCKSSSLCHNTDNKTLEKWEDVIPLSNTIGLYTSVVSHVFLTSAWRNTEIDVSEKYLFETFDSTFPHLSVAFKNYVGQPIFYIGTPLILFFVGKQEWFSANWSRLVCTHVLDFTKQLEKNNVEVELVDFYRNLIFKNGINNFIQYLNSLTFKEYLRYLIKNKYYFKYLNFNKILYYIFNKKLIDLIKKSVTVTKLVKKIRSSKP